MGVKVTLVIRDPNYPSPYSTLLDTPPTHGEETACSACREHGQIPLPSCRQSHAHYPLAEGWTGLPWGESHWRHSGESWHPSPSAPPFSFFPSSPSHRSISLMRKVITEPQAMGGSGSSSQSATPIFCPFVPSALATGDSFCVLVEFSLRFIGRGTEDSFLFIFYFCVNKYHMH